MKTKLKVLRAKKNITQSQLAEILGVKQNVVSKWERGDSVPRPDMMQRIEDYFKVPKEDIFFTAFNYPK